MFGINTNKNRTTMIYSCTDDIASSREVYSKLVLSAYILCCFQAFYQAMLVATDVFSSYVGSYSSKPAVHCVVLSRFWVQRYPDK